MPNPEDVLVLHAGALGDCVLTLHVVAAMQTAWGGASVTMAARSPIARWARRHGLLDNAVSLDSINAHQLFQPAGQLSRELEDWLNRFDFVVSFLAGPEEPVSRRLTRLHHGTVVSINPRPSPQTARRGLHITEQWIRGLASAGFLVPSARRAMIDWAESERRKLQSKLSLRLEGQGRPVALCHPGSGGRDKCCPLEALERLTGGLMEAGWAVGWMVGPDEVERFGPAYARRLESSAPVLFEESVETAADLACGAEGYLGHDAGMTHVVAIAGVRTLAIFGPTDPRVWGPLGSSVEVIGFPPPEGEIDPWVRAARLRMGRG